VQGYTGTPDTARHTIPMALLSNSQSDADASLEPASVTKSGSTHSMSGMAAVAGFGVGPVGSLPSIASASTDTSHRSVKQHRRSANVIRAPIASAEELSPSSPQGYTPSEDPTLRQLPAGSESLTERKSNLESLPHQRERAATKVPRSSTKDDIPSENVASAAAAVQPKLSSYKPASRLGKATGSFCPVSDSSQLYVVDNGLPSSLPSLPGAVRRPNSFVHAMTDQLVVSTEPRGGRGTQSPILEVSQPEEEMSSIFEFSV